MNEPKTAHLVAAKRILRYLKGTINNGISFTNNKIKNRIYGYCDADFAGDLDTRKLTTDICVCQWKSHHLVFKETKQCF